MTSFAPRVDQARGPNPYDAAQTFAESDVSLSQTGTTVSGESLGLLTNLQGSLDHSDETWNTDYQAADTLGWLIEGSREITAVSGTAVAGTTPTTAYVKRHSDGTVIAQTSIDSNNQFTMSGLSLSAGTQYRVMVDAAGASYTYAYSTSDPTLPEDFNEYATLVASLDRNNVKSTDQLHGLEDCTVELADSLSGTAYVGWPNPTDIYGWDVATFTRSPDGETVDVYVAVDDGTGWTRINSGDPISRNYSLADDPAVTASDDVRIEAELSRNDLSNNPTLDSAYRSWML